MRFLGCIINLLCVHILTTHLYSLPSNMRFSDAREDPGFAQPAIESEKTSEEGSKGLGTKEIERPDGGKDKIYYSITTPEEERNHQEEEKEKLEKSFEMLRNIIIDNRGK